MYQYKEIIQKMISFDDVTKENIKEHTLNWPQIPHYLDRILIIGGSGSRKTNLLFNWISHQADIEKNYLMLKMHMKQSINWLLAKTKVQD